MDDGGGPTTEQHDSKRAPEHPGHSTHGDTLFLTELYESLEALGCPTDIAAAATRLLGSRLGADRCAYFRISEAGDPELLGDFRRPGSGGIGQLSDEALREIWRLARKDAPSVVDRDGRLPGRESPERAEGAGPALCVPLREGDRPVAGLILMSERPRSWTARETELAVYAAHHCRVVLRRSQVVSDLAEQEARYRALFNSIDQGFYICEVYTDDNDTPVDYRFLEINPMFEKLTGISNAHGRTARESVPDLEAHWFDIYGRVALTGEPLRFVEHSQALGRWFDVYAFRIGGDESRTVAVLFSNITEQKLAEAERKKLHEELELERSRLEQVFREAPAAITTVRGPEHVFEMANPLYRELVGHRDLIGKTVREALPDIADQGFFELLDRVYRTGESHVGRSTRVVLSREDGTSDERYLDFVYLPLREVDGTVTGIFVHAVDVTAHKRAEQALARAHDQMEQRVEERTEELRALNAELESFNYSVSHDLRAPLRGINGFSQVLLEDHADSLDETARHYLHRIGASTNRMSKIIDDLLALSQLTRVPATPVVVDLTALARGVVAELRENEPGRRVDVIVEPGLEAFADPSLLRVVLENLLGNAWKFTRNVERGRIEVGAVDHSGETAYFVRDNGAGFSMEYAHKLFLPFQRLHGPDEYEGTGIGLATVQRIIHKHDGSIWAEGRPDEGAVFYFTLPRGDSRPLR